MKRRVTAAFGLLALVAACERGPEDPTPSAQPAPEWADPQADTGQPTAAVVSPPDPTPIEPVFVGEADAAAEPVIIALVDQSVSLKERFHVGERVRRDMRIERSYRVQVQAHRAASVQGRTERVISYVVDVTDAIGGQIVAATVTVESDTRRLLPAGDEARNLTPRDALTGVSFDCRLNAEAGFDCEMPAREGRRLGIAGIVPQRPGTHPGRPASVGDSWEIDGAEARHFLGIDGADAVVVFTFDEADAEFRDRVCHHISYTFTGTQPLRLSGRTLGAELSGSGELYHCRRPNAIVYHRQERDVSAQANGRRPGSAMPIERVEHILFEEETSIEAADSAPLRNEERPR